MTSNRGAPVSQKSRSHLRILGAREMPQITFYTEDPQISSATIQNSFARVIWYLGFVHACLHMFSTLVQNIYE